MRCDPFKVFVFVFFILSSFLIHCPISLAQDTSATEDQTKELLVHINDLQKKMDENARLLAGLQKSINQAVNENAPDANANALNQQASAEAVPEQIVSPKAIKKQASPVSSSTSQAVADQNSQFQNGFQGDQNITGPFDPITARIISDPLYLPLKGQFFGSTEYDFYRSKENVYGYDGTEFASNYGDRNRISQMIEYGLTSDLTLRFEDGYGFDRQYDDGFKNKWIGFTDPEFGATYRVIDQARYPVDVDLTANYHPDAISDHASSGGKTGTVADGRQELDLEESIGREMKDLTLRAYIQQNYLGDERYKGDDYEIEYTGSWDYTFGFNTQTRLTDRFSVNFGTSYTVANNAEYRELTTGFSDIYVPANYWSFNTSFNYQIIPDRLVSRLIYTYNDYYTSKYLNSVIFNDEEDERHSENIFGLELSYLFI